MNNYGFGQSRTVACSFLIWPYTRLHFFNLTTRLFAINVVYWRRAMGTDISGSDLAAPNNPSSFTWKIK